MIRVYKYNLSKADFAAMPREDRALILLAGQTINLINTWLKLIRLSSQHPAEWPVEQKLIDSQTHILLRALFGAMHEAWVWQTRQDMGPLISRKYLPLLPEEAIAARKVLSKRLGGKGSLIEKLRNGFAFHNPTTAALDKAFQATPENEDWSWYVTDDLPTTFYLSCELVVGYGVAGAVAAPGFIEGFRHVLNETIEIANAMNLYMTSVLAVALANNLPAKPEGTLEREISNAPNLETFSLPFYVEGI